MPIATEPSCASLGSQNGTVKVPLSSRQFETLRNDLFASTFDYTAADQIALSAKFGVTHSLKVIVIIGERLFSQVGFLGELLAGFNDQFYSALP